MAFLQRDAKTQQLEKLDEEFRKYKVKAQTALQQSEERRKCVTRSAWLKRTWLKRTCLRPLQGGNGKGSFGEEAAEGGAQTATKS